MTTRVAELGFDSQALLDLTRRTDPVGVLSIYTEVAPGADGRLAAIEVKNRLSELEQRVTGEGPRERARAVRGGIARLAPEIEQLLGIEQPGRGRVLFAALQDGWSRLYVSQLALPMRVVLDSGPFIHPLLELLDEGRLMGVVLASRAEARLLEWRLGELRPLGALTAEVAEPPHERSGPVGSPPAERYGTPTGEQRNARERDQAARFMERVAGTSSSLAAERGWERILVSGGEQLTDPLLGALAPAVRKIALRDPRVLLPLDLPKLTELVTERAHDAHRAYEQALIEQTHEQAQQMAPVALGLSDVVGALNQARVSHLIYDPAVRYRGALGPDGILFAGEETPAGDTVTPESRLTERLVERALSTGARVTPIEGAASSGLVEAAGIVALLRW